MSEIDILIKELILMNGLEEYEHQKSYALPGIYDYHELERLKKLIIGEKLNSLLNKETKKQQLMYLGNIWQANQYQSEPVQLNKFEVA